MIKEVLAHPGGKASGESAAFLRVLTEMSTDAVAAPGTTADHDGGGEGSGVDGSGGAGGSGEQGEAGIAAIDDAEAFHLKTVRDSSDEARGDGECTRTLLTHVSCESAKHRFTPSRGIKSSGVLFLEHGRSAYSFISFSEIISN